MGFDEFMALALYSPGLGYYSGPARKFGVHGDFVTAPEISPMFGACLAQQIAAWMEAAEITHLVEFGAGTGQLATQILNELGRLGITPSRYSIIELSANLRSQQKGTLEALSPQCAHLVDWLDHIPGRLQAIVFSNELLDAMPVRLFAWDGEVLFERGVCFDEKTQSLAWADQLAGQDFKKSVQESLITAGVESLADLPAPYISEIHEQGQAWIRTVSKQLETGCVLTLDYGFPAREYFHVQRDRGTLACHYRHRVGFDPFINLGEQDITAHVDFTSMHRSATDTGMTLAGFCSQARFLMNTGILDRLGQQPKDRTLAYASQAHAVGKLLSEAEMGELFKAIAWVKSTDSNLKNRLMEASFAFDPGGRSL
jgi:SAM-dependent MidA family methyltransferase